MEIEFRCKIFCDIVHGLGEKLNIFYKALAGERTKHFLQRHENPSLAYLLKFLRESVMANIG